MRFVIVIELAFIGSAWAKGIRRVDWLESNASIIQSKSKWAKAISNSQVIMTIPTSRPSNQPQSLTERSTAIHTQYIKMKVKPCHWPDQSNRKRSLGIPKQKAILDFLSHLTVVGFPLTRLPLARMSHLHASPPCLTIYPTLFTTRCNLTRQAKSQDTIGLGGLSRLSKVNFKSINCFDFIFPFWNWEKTNYWSDSKRFFLDYFNHSADQRQWAFINQPRWSDINHSINQIFSQIKSTLTIDLP